MSDDRPTSDLRQQLQDIWKPIKDYEEWYEVSNTGKIRSIKRLVVYKNGHRHTYPSVELKPWVASSKYFTVQLVRNSIWKSFSVHRLIAIAFIDNPENKPYINHKDGNKLNNSLDNLEWCTAHENIVHAFDTGLRRHIQGEDKKVNKLTDENVREIRKLKGTMSSRLIGQRYDVDGSTIRRVLNGRSWTHIK